MYFLQQQISTHPVVNHSRTVLLDKTEEYLEDHKQVTVNNKGLSQVIIKALAL